MLNQDEYRETFNGEAEVAGCAPGRVNLIGQFFMLTLNMVNLIGLFLDTQVSLAPTHVRCKSVR